MIKNKSGQKWRVFAFDRTTNQPVTGDAANITAKISGDYGTATTLTTPNPVETEDGYYVFSLTKDETNYDDISIYPESSTANVQVIGVPGNQQPATIPTATTTTPTTTTTTTYINPQATPKRVKTKEVEIEAHDPMKLQTIQERNSRKPVTLGQFPRTNVVPKEPCPVEKRPPYYYPYEE